MLARRGRPDAPADGPAEQDPDLRGGQPEGRRRQDHVDGQHRRRPGPARPAGAGHRPRPAGQRLDRARGRAPPGRALDVRRPRRRRAPRRRDEPVARRGEPLGRAGDDRPRRRRDRAGLGRRAREPAAQGRARPPLGRHRGRGGGGPLRLRPDRLPAVAGAAHPERPGRRRRDADPDPGGVLRARGPRAAARDRRDGPRAPQPGPGGLHDPGDDVRRPHPARRPASPRRSASTSATRCSRRRSRARCGSPRRRRTARP